ncbi:NAD(P)H-dependent oxidoreductase [Patescibacteria group bacterium]|nr:NAD(P)H-dependent oxidoreductase [Patescibacteria group bacterium]
MDKLKIATLLGSLRKDSFNKSLLNYVMEISKDTLDISIIDINLPLFNEDMESNPTDSVLKLRNTIKDSDGVLIITPEYNYSIPGLLKNAIDWGSRPYTENVFSKKPMGLIGASSGAMGTVRSQSHIRQVCTFLNAFVMNKPEVLITFSKDKFDNNNKLIDSKTKDIIDEFVNNFEKWVKAINQIKDLI